ncbi:hypothetical protein BC939DRAFT_455457 [Gamsiella multidivaricata]|uniref:uncharacterized protein n=1 Tax=Gamsiella multidivaricata TaxID=101098 RepID=UPI00221EF374|nr:uncharacterized protein BC939DRAFT_455457 [Gamsiella multidivaricata]KAI7821533.1 hypothetical protein BC939DRAFT_455457 [Gamsiella multidivaricata]
MRSASNGAFDGSGYYWDTQHHHRYPSQAQPSYFREEQLQYSSALQHGLPLQHLQYQPYHQSYHCHGPTSMVHSNTNTYVPETDTCSSTAMVSNTTTTTGLFPEIQGSAETSSSAIPAAMSHLYPPIYPSSEPSSEPLQRDDVVPIDSQAGEQGFKHVANPNATSSSPLVRPRLFSSPLVHMGDDVLKEERKKDRYVSIDTVGTTGSELSSVQDYASD